MSFVASAVHSEQVMSGGMKLQLNLLLIIIATFKS